MKAGCAVSLTLGPHRSFPCIINTYSREGDYITGTENSLVPRDQAELDAPVLMVPRGAVATGPWAPPLLQS